MKRTRKWAFVAQEASRLAELGLTPPEIARRIDVKRSTVNRWMAAGKLADTRGGAGAAKRGAPGTYATRLTKPSEWAAAVRREYSLDATDDQLVTLAETMLGMSQDPLQAASVRVSAAGRYAALVKQLALVARAADAPAKPESEAPAVPVRQVIRPTVDPRHILAAVK